MGDQCGHPAQRFLLLHEDAEPVTACLEHGSGLSQLVLFAAALGDIAADRIRQTSMPHHVPFEPAPGAVLAEHSSLKSRRLGAACERTQSQRTRSRSSGAIRLIQGCDVISSSE